MKAERNRNRQTPLRVLQVLGRLDRGGAETMIMNLYRNIDRSRVQFDFVLHTQEECDYSEEVRRLGGRILSVPAFGPKSAGSYRRAWRELLDGYPEYRILHSHVRSTASLYLPEASRRGLATIVHSHNTSSGNGIGAVVKGLLQLPLRFQADYLFACSQAAGEWLYGKKACRSAKFRVLKNAIDTGIFTFDAGIREEARSELGLLPGQLVVGHAGRFEEQKNHSFLLRIFAEIKKQLPGAVLLLAGDGALREKIRLEALQLGLETSEGRSPSAAGDVCFLGVCADMNRLFMAMDVFLFPSLYEGLPVTLVEAQASGLPVVVSDTVTREADVSVLPQKSLMTAVSLAGDVSVWAAKTMEAPRKSPYAGRRPEAAEAVIQSGYDIRATAEWLQEFYMRL